MFANGSKSSSLHIIMVLMGKHFGKTTSDTMQVLLRLHSICLTLRKHTQSLVNKVGNAPGSQFRMWLKASVAFRVSFFRQVCWVAVVSGILCKPTACLGWPPCTGLNEVGVRRGVCWVFWPSARLGGARLDAAPRVIEQCEPWSVGRAPAGREGESYNSRMERSGRIKKKL